MTTHRERPPADDLEGGFELHRESTGLAELLREVARSGPLIAALARQNFYVRYRRASFGILWALALPLMQAIVLAFVFSQVVHIGAQEHYIVFLLAGLTAWTFFGTSVQAATTSIVDGSGLSTRIYFPRMVFPLVIIGANLYGYVLTVGLLVGAAIVDGAPLGMDLLWLLPASVLLVALTGAFSILLSGLHVYFRDMRYIVQAALIAWFYATPIIYSLDQTQSYGRLLTLNPVTGVVLLFRAAVIGRDQYLWASLGWTIAWTVVLLVAGVLVHRRFDRVFADLM